MLKVHYLKRIDEARDRKASVKTRRMGSVPPTLPRSLEAG